MIELDVGQKPVTFSPDLYAHDACANYWIRQVTTRLRREICWIWHERGLHSYSQTSTLPPFEDKIPAILDMSRFREEKQKFFKVDPTARYLTEQLESDIPCLGQLPVRGSFEWAANRLGLDDVSCFVLALGLSVSFDNAVGGVVASCLNDPMKNHPNLALAQKLWDDPDLLEVPAKTVDETRSIVTGTIAGKHWSGVITYRSKNICIISVRRSRKEEVALYES